MDDNCQSSSMPQSHARLDVRSTGRTLLDEQGTLLLRRRGRRLRLRRWRPARWCCQCLAATLTTAIVFFSVVSIFGISRSCSARWRLSVVPVAPWRAMSVDHTRVSQVFAPAPFGFGAGGHATCRSASVSADSGPSRLSRSPCFPLVHMRIRADTAREEAGIIKSTRK